MVIRQHALRRLGCLRALEQRMAGRWLKLGELGVLATILVAGCKLPCADKPYPHDPLFESKSPVEKAAAAPSADVFVSAAPEPKAPAFPQIWFASSNHLREPATKNTVQGLPVATLRQPLVGIPAVRSNTGQNSSLSYDHGEDYRWLQGVLEKSYDGSFTIRYCESTHPDRWSGRVRLDEDPRLAHFHDGDLVHIDGILIPPLEPAEQAAWDYCPRYRISHIQSLQN